MRSEGTAGDGTEDSTADSWPGVHLESDGAREDAHRSADAVPGSSAQLDLGHKAPGPDAAIEPNTVIADRYVLQRPLGRGGMGVVWEALDTRLNRQVAVKGLLYQGAVDPRTQSQWVERARREAQAIARIGHQNVVSVHDVIEADSQVWIVMELLNARSLADLLHEQQLLPVPQTTRIGLQVLRGLRAVHKAGVLHRDVKPGNVLFRPNGRALLMDFGIATFEGAVQVTRMHEVIGTPMYIAPELVSPAPGRLGGATSASDLWSLGVTLYEMVEGRSPFPGIAPLEIHVAVRDSPVRPMRYAGPLSPVIDALLQKDPGQRPDAAQTEEMLLAVTNDPPPLYTPPLHPTPVRPPAAPPVSVEPALPPATAEPAPSPGTEATAEPAPSPGTEATAEPAPSPGTEATAEPAPTSAPAPVPPPAELAPAAGPPSVPPPVSPSPQPGASPTAPAPRKRGRTWQAALAATLCMGLLGGVGWYAWDRSQEDAKPPGSEAKQPSYTTFKDADHKTLTFGVKKNQPGLSKWIRNHKVNNVERGVYEGFEIALAYKIAEKMEYDEEQVIFEQVTSLDRDDQLNRREVDLVLATYSISEKRKEEEEAKKVQIAMVGPYYLTGRGIMIRKKHVDKFKEADELQDGTKEVCTAKNSTYVKDLKDAGYTVREVTSYSTCLDKLKEEGPKDQVYAVSTDEVILRGFAHANPGKFVMLPPLDGTEEWGVAMRRMEKNSKTRLDLEVCGALKEIIKDGTWDDLYNEHLRPAMNKAARPPDVTKCDTSGQFD